MLELDKYCQYLYGLLRIPVCLYDSKARPVYCYPPQMGNILPPSDYIYKLLGTDKKVQCITTAFNWYYGSVRVEKEHLFIVLGPAGNMPYSKRSFETMLKELYISTPGQDFYSLLSSIPPVDKDTFTNILLFVNYTINGQALTKSDVMLPDEHDWNAMVNARLYEEMYRKKEEGIFNNSYEIEGELMEYIETGNVKGLHNFIKNPKRISGGILANDGLRHAKNMFICAITLAARAAIRGGLSPQTAFQLSDIYIQQAEQLNDIQSVNSLLVRAMFEYAGRVASLSIPVSADGVLNRVVEYVRTNTNKNITVSDIADHFGFSRSHLSHKFKKAFGIELKRFILQCKLEEARLLLKYSNRSISEISSYLCFANQSHFQRAFKKQFGITPNNYRKTCLLRSER